MDSPLHVLLETRRKSGGDQPTERPEFLIPSVAGEFEDCFLKKTANFFFFYLKKDILTVLEVSRIKS